MTNGSKLLSSFVGALDNIFQSKGDEDRNDYNINI
jgi:hypothetical protein